MGGATIWCNGRTRRGSCDHSHFQPLSHAETQWWVRSSIYWFMHSFIHSSIHPSFLPSFVTISGSCSIFNSSKFGIGSLALELPLLPLLPSVYSSKHSSIHARFLPFLPCYRFRFLLHFQFIKIRDGKSRSGIATGGQTDCLIRGVGRNKLIELLVKFVILCIQ